MKIFEPIESEKILTRYLYPKKYVNIIFIICLLERNEDAIFWAYELYYSGYEIELIEYIWSIYYDFYAILNPNLELILPELLSNNTFEINLNYIIQDLLQRPYTTDVYLLRHGYTIFNNEFNKIMCDIIYIEENIEYINYYKNIYITLFGLLETTSAYKKTIQHFEQLIYNIPNTKNNHNIKQQISLSKILRLFAKYHKINIGPKYLIYDTSKTIEHLKTIDGDIIQHYRILEYVYSCNLNYYIQNESEKQLTQIECDYYWDNWEYYASFSPLWATRISQYYAKINHIDYKYFLEFESDEMEELFYSKFGLEPDEQLLFVQQYRIPNINYKQLLQYFVNKLMIYNKEKNL